MTGRQTYHLGQMAAALTTFIALTTLSSYATVQADGPRAAAWTAPAVASWVLWLFALVWTLIVYSLALARMARTVLHSRPAPGHGGAPLPRRQTAAMSPASAASLATAEYETDTVDPATEARNRSLIEAWPPPDLGGEFLTHARHARAEATA